MDVSLILQRESGEYAWDGVNNVEIPLKAVREARRGASGPETRDREDLFCATPPLELLRFLLSRQATRRKDGRERKTMFIDVEKAHLVPECHEDAYVELPDEAEFKEDGRGALLYWLYGWRRAGQAWEDRYSDVLKHVVFERAMSSPVVFYHSGRDFWAVVHGGDLAFTGMDGDQDCVMQELVKHYETKNRGRLGSGT